jgi:hypothetical protein
VLLATFVDRMDHIAQAAKASSRIAALWCAAPRGQKELWSPSWREKVRRRMKKKTQTPFPYARLARLWNNGHTIAEIAK